MMAEILQHLGFLIEPHNGMNHCPQQVSLLSTDACDFGHQENSWRVQKTSQMRPAIAIKIARGELLGNLRFSHGPFRGFFFKDPISTIENVSFLIVQFDRKVAPHSPIQVIWNYPPPSNSHHQDHSIFNRGSQ